MRCVLASLLLFAAAALFGSVQAQAQTFAPADEARLARGETIERRQTLQRGSDRYVGGVTYTVLASSPAELDSVFADVTAFRRFLPYTKDARVIARDPNELAVWLREGTSFLDASYTIRVRREIGAPAAPHVVHFWLDRSRPHGIDDASGYFRYEPITPDAAGGPRVLLTFGIWVDIGPGLVRTFFEGRIQGVVLSVPQRVRDYLAARASSAARAR